MTREEMLAGIAANLMLEKGDSLLTWVLGTSGERQLDAAADDTAQATDCYTAEQIDDLTLDQAEYCFPKIYKPKAWYVVDENGNRHVLIPRTSHELDRCGGFTSVSFGFTSTGTGETGWRTWTAQDYPTYRVMSGLTSFLVAPVAKATRAGGIIVAGFALSTLPITGRDKHQWDLPTDECPLPSWAHNAVVLKATANIARMLKVKNGAYRQIEQDYNNDWQLACGEVASQAAKNYRGF